MGAPRRHAWVTADRPIHPRSDRTAKPTTVVRRWNSGMVHLNHLRLLSSTQWRPRPDYCRSAEYRLRSSPG
jgi:hypothetical protein